MAGFANYMAPVLIGAPDRVFQRFFSCLRSSKPSYFGPWLAGLFEGDGHIWIPATEYAPSGKKYTPLVQITFCISDIPLVLWLQNLIGGNVNKIGDGACRLTISSIPQLCAFVLLVSPYMCTPKLDQLNALILWLNENKSQNIPLAIINCSPIGLIGWLAGFIDADGSFHIRVNEIATGSLKNRVAIRFSLEQRIMDPKWGGCYNDVINAIAAFLGATLNVTNHNGREYYCVQVSSVAQLTILMDYLNQYPLLSGKRMDRLAANSCFDLITSKAHMTPEGREKAKHLKASMNSKRTEWDWSHLSN